MKKALSLLILASIFLGAPFAYLYYRTGSIEQAMIGLGCVYLGVAVLIGAITAATKLWED